MKEYYIDNKEQLLEYQKEYQQLNKEQLLEYQKEYRINNKEVLLYKAKEYYNNNKEQLAETRKEYYNTNKDKINQKIKCSICNKEISRYTLTRCTEAFGHCATSTGQKFEPKPQLRNLPLIVL